ncbi:Ribonuclease 3 [Operophtera brumata]|uniref:Ribonuclease 3 n=1 Tax=Operophtera brumata TaxID=104452 RepID=A0A0L7KUX2_OPEBR|nr:Ribonuclease 3 [Operophtera brumata]
MDHYYWQKYQKRWRFYVKFRHLIANMAKPTYKDRRRLAAREAKLQEMRTQTKMKRDVTVAISSKGFHTTGLMCDVVQHLIASMAKPTYKDRRRLAARKAKLQEMGTQTKMKRDVTVAISSKGFHTTGLMCDVVQHLIASMAKPTYKDRRRLAAREAKLQEMRTQTKMKRDVTVAISSKGFHTTGLMCDVVQHLIASMAKPTYKDRRRLAAREAKLQEMRTQTKMKRDIKHNERLEFLGDAVVEFISSIHLFKMFPSLAEGGLATYRASIVQNQHLAHLARVLEFISSIHLFKIFPSLTEGGLATYRASIVQNQHLAHLARVMEFISSIHLFKMFPSLAEGGLATYRASIFQNQHLAHLARVMEFISSIHFFKMLPSLAEGGLAACRASIVQNQHLAHLARVREITYTLVEFISSIHLFKMLPSLAEGGLAACRASIVQNQHLAHLARVREITYTLVEFISSIHFFKMLPSLAEGGLAACRASIVQNQHLAHLARVREITYTLVEFISSIHLFKMFPSLVEGGLATYRASPGEDMLYAHGSDLCREVVMKHAMANCFEALMGALFLDAGLQVRICSCYVEFKHIRLLARAFTDRSVGFTHLTLGSNQRLEFLGDTVLQLVVSDRLYRHFPDHHEGHLSLLRSSLVNNRTQSMVCDDLNLSEFAIYNNPKSKPSTKKHKADLLEAFLGALYIDRGLDYCQAFCNACLFPRLQEFIMNQDWNDPKSKLQQCCLTLRSMEGGEPDIPLYKVIECLGPTNTRVYTVGVYFRGTRLASARGHSIQEAEMHAAEMALSNAHELFPQLDHQKRVIAKSTSKRKRGETRKGRDVTLPVNSDKVPKAYRVGHSGDVTSDDSVHEASDAECVDSDKSDDDSGLDSDAASLPPEKLHNIEVSSLLSDMEKIKADMIDKNHGLRGGVMHGFKSLGACSRSLPSHPTTYHLSSTERPARWSHAWISSLRARVVAVSFHILQPTISPRLSGLRGGVMHGYQVSGRV